RPTFNPEDVCPGIESFLIAFILAVALLGLLWSMSRHLRRVQVRAKLNEEARQAAASTQAAAGSNSEADSTVAEADSPAAEAEFDDDAAPDPESDSSSASQ